MADSGSNATEEGIVLAGLDGGTPLGFLAALGVQRVLADGGDAGCRLAFCRLDAWRPVLHGPPSFDAVVDTVVADALAWAEAPILRFRYLKLEKSGQTKVPKPFAGLKAPVAVLRQWLLDRRAAGDTTSLAYACALMCETASEPAGEAPGRDQLREHGIPAAPDAPVDQITKPTFFDLTSRNMQFLDQIDRIRASLDRDRIAAGLRDGTPDRDAPRSMDWDPAADTPGAIYTGFQRGFLPAAEWLAFRGLCCLPLTGVGQRLQATACSGRRHDGWFVWPLWEVPAGPDTVRSLVAHPGLERLGSPARRALGIAAVLRAGLTKKADGKSGMFSPSQPA